MQQIVFGSVDAYGHKRSVDEVRIIREMLDEDVSRFVTESGIDGPAARELRSEAPEIQWAVMQRGPVRSAANPSAALVGRIRDAKHGITRFGGVAAPAALPPAIVNPDPDKPLSEVDRFIMENRLDQSAASTLKAETAEVQRTVMQQGPLVNCYNPSGALMGRIRAARNGQVAYRPAAAAVGLPPANPLPPQHGQGMLALPGMQGAPALMDNGMMGGGIGDDRLTQEAMRAIQKLGGDNGGAAHAPGPVTACASVEDSRLNEEAMKAIQMLNAGGP